MALPAVLLIYTQQLSICLTKNIIVKYLLKCQALKNQALVGLINQAIAYKAMLEYIA
ncbi:hypothetical protein H1P_4390004 [Hyella patelloides LEGE 07179]|uniref:Uncharacterized protein n=1 Tax=Hyella patelloides LEGE 07179 TaxID=945734 RepID=A0A563VY48_9CYAN|nr:hypothetical protein H1P_4390004 [Hyella patelloides LEGE 07179]